MGQKAGFFGRHPDQISQKLVPTRHSEAPRADQHVEEVARYLFLALLRHII